MENVKENKKVELHLKHGLSVLPNLSPNVIETATSKSLSKARDISSLDAVYVDAKKTKSIVAIKPKPPFKPVLQVAASRQGSDIHIINEPINGSIFLVDAGKVESIPETTLFSGRFSKNTGNILQLK